MLAIGRQPGQCLYVGAAIRVELVSIDFPARSVELFVSIHGSAKTLTLDQSSDNWIAPTVKLGLVRIQGHQAAIGIQAPTSLQITRDTPPAERRIA